MENMETGGVSKSENGLENEIKQEQEALISNIEKLKENEAHFASEDLSEADESTVQTLREKIGNSITTLCEKLLDIDKEKVLIPAVGLAFASMLAPFAGTPDFHDTLQMLPDTLREFLQRPELAGNAFWSIAGADGNPSLPSVENFQNTLQNFQNMPEGQSMGARAVSSLANFATVGALVGVAAAAGNALGKIGVYLGKKA